MKLNRFVNQQKEDLLKLRLMETEIHESGLLSPDFFKTLERLEDRQDAEKTEIIAKLARDYGPAMDYQASYEQIKPPFKDDLVYMDYDREAYLFIGAHGKMAIRTIEEDEEKDHLIEGFNDHVLAVAKTKRKGYLIAGTEGNLKRLSLEKNKGVFRDLAYTSLGDIHFIKEVDGQVLLLGSSGLRAFYKLRGQGGFDLVEDRSYTDLTWIFGDSCPEGLLSVSDRGAIYLDQEEVAQFGQKVHGVLRVANHYLVYGDQGKIVLFSIKDRAIIRDFSGISGPIYQALDLDGQEVLAYESNGKGHLINLKTGEVNHAIEAFGSYISGANKLGQDTYLLGGWSGYVSKVQLEKPETFDDYMRRYKETIGWA